MQSSTSFFARHLTTASRLGFCLAITAITYLAFSDQSGSTVVSYSDKLNHWFAFFSLAVLLDYSVPQQLFSSKKIIALITYGAAIEIIQGFIPYRESSLLDLVIDSLGILTYLLLMPAIMKIPPLNQRKITIIDEN